MQKTTYKQSKIDTINAVEKLLKTHKTIAFCSLFKVRGAQLMSLRKSFKDEMRIRVVRNTLTKLAIEKSQIKNSKELSNGISKQQALIFTDMNPFKLFLVLEKGKIDLAAREGDIATDDIVIPAGNTGMQPGPDLSIFKEFNIATRINVGSIFVNNDTVAAKKGDVLSANLASLLSKLSIKPIKAGISITLAYMDGLLYNSDDVAINLTDYMNDISNSYQSALNLAVNQEYFTKETVPLLLADAFNKSKNLSIESEYLTKDNASFILAKKQLEAQILSNLIKSN